MAAITPLTDTKLLVALHESAFDAAWDAPFFEALLKKSGAQAFGSEDGFILMQPLSGDGQMIEAEILTLAVRPTARRGGLAGRLIVHAQLALAANRIFLKWRLIIMPRGHCMKNSDLMRQDDAKPIIKGPTARVRMQC